jgi:radical SAM protein with 4Fe4S-binding SPASM domain
LSFPQLLHVSDELIALGCKTVNLTGGEPLLRPEWAELASHLTGHGVDVAVVSNGTLFDESSVKRAVGAGVAAVSVSLDGLQSTHDTTRRFARGAGSTFEAAIEGLKCAQKHLPVSVITQVNRTNLSELHELGVLLGNLGVSRWQLQLVVPTPRVMGNGIPYALLPEDLEAITAFIVETADNPQIPMIHTSDTIGYATPAEVVLRRKASGPGLWFGCVAGIRAVAIKYDGVVRGCSLLPADFDAGNLHELSFTEIWRDSSRFAYSTEFNASHLSGGCKRCRFGTICRAGCTTMAYFATGTTGDNPYCLYRVRGNCGGGCS